MHKKEDTQIKELDSNITQNFLKDQRGMGVVEVILIIVVLVAMVAIFKDEIGDLVENIWRNINSDAKDIYSS